MKTQSTIRGSHTLLFTNGKVQKEKNKFHCENISLIRAEYRTGGPGVLYCPAGQDATLFFVLSYRLPG